MRFNFAFLLAAAVCFTFTPSTPLSADTVIDLQGLPDNFQQSSWNGGGTRIYAQSIETPSTDTILDFISFNVQGTSAVDYDLIISGARPNTGGLGFAPDYSDIRYSMSGSLTGDATVSAEPNLALSSSELFFVSLVGQTDSAAAYTVEATQFNGPDQYLPGEFVFFNAEYSDALTSGAINGAEFGHRFDNGEDLAFRAEFSAVPEPSSMMAVGLGLLVFVRRKSRSC